MLLIMAILYHVSMTYLISKFNLYLGMAYFLYIGYHTLMGLEEIRMRREILSKFNPEGEE